MSTKKFICEKCKKTFSSVGNLNFHIKTSCSDDIEYINCEFCNQQFKLKSSLTRHLSICKAKLKEDATKEQNVKDENTTLKTEIKILKDKHKIDLKTTKDKYEIEINNLKKNLKLAEENYKQQITRLEAEIKVLTEFMDTLSDKSTVQNTNSNNTYININANIFDNLKSITDETFFQYGQELTQSVLLQGIESVIGLCMKHLKDKIVCTDRARNTLNYKINDQLVKDKGGVRLAEQIIEQSIEPKVKMYDKTLVDTYNKKSRDHTVLKEEQSRLDSMIELRNAIISNDQTLKAKIGSKLSKRAPTNHSLLADLNGATTQNMWEFFNQVDKTRERILFNSVEYFLVRDANKNVIRALEVDDDGCPITESQIDFSEQVHAQNQKLLPPPTRQQDQETVKKQRGRPRKKVSIPSELR
jgi:hypothetical protein